MKQLKKPITKSAAGKPKSRAPALKTVSKKPIVKRLAKQQIRRSRPIHKRIALHPISGFALLLVGVFLVSWTLQTFAATSGTTISATIEAPALTSAATISSPHNGDTVSNSSLTITGSCPSSSYVNLTINNVFSGTDMCSGSNTYSILTSLANYSNTLQVQDYNLTDQAGPTTPTISVTYTNGHVMGASTVTPSESDPLILTSNFSYHTYSTAENFSWPLSFTGGKAPYTLSTDWQDGSKPTITVFKSPQAMTILHHYKYSAYYVVHLQLVDGARTVRLLQLGALITAPGSSYVPGISTPLKPSLPANGFASTELGHYLTATRLWLWVAWPSFIVVMLMVFSFWLGERQEYQDIFTTGNRSKSHRRTVSKQRRRTGLSILTIEHGKGMGPSITGDAVL